MDLPTNSQLRVLAFGLLVSITACSTSATEVGSTGLLAVFPAPGSSGVAMDAPIEVRFGAPISSGTMHPIALQVGDCPGPVVMGTWSRTVDGLGLRFQPSQPLDPATQYTIHVGGGMTDAEGALVDLERNVLGGMWVTREMVMGMMGMGMTQHSGTEWQSPNGLYGLAFSFTTAP